MGENERTIEKKCIDMEEDVIKATQSGRLYITTEDFFRRQKFKDLLKKLKGSLIYKQAKQAMKASID